MPDVHARTSEYALECRAMETWYFYLARCSDGSLYAGVCIDLEQREAAHNDGVGAKYTRGRRPVWIVYSERFGSKSNRSRLLMRRSLTGLRVSRASRGNDSPPPR